MAAPWSWKSCRLDGISSRTSYTSVGAVVLSKRKPLKMTTREAPISAAMAAHNAASPNIVKTAKIAFTISDRAMFWRMPQRATRMADQPGKLRQIIGHQCNVGGFDGGIAARSAHGDPERRPCQGRCVVHAIAHHCHSAEAGNQRLNRTDLIGRQQFSVHFIDAGKLCDCLGGGTIVAGEHDQVFDAGGSRKAVAASGRTLSATVISPHT